jgi:hypothetical protein
LHLNGGDSRRGGAGDTGRRSRRRRTRSRGGELDVGGDPDSWSPAVSGRAKKKRGTRLLGCGGPQAGCEGRRGQTAWLLRGLRRKGNRPREEESAGLKRKKGRERGLESFLFLFLFFHTYFKLLKLNSFSNS